MTYDFTKLETSHFDSRAKRKSFSPQILEELTRKEIESPIKESYQSWLEALRAAKPENPTKILDYCAGLGHHTITIQREFPQAIVTGIDLSEDSLRIAEKALRQIPLPKQPTFLKMDAHKTTFPDNHFDLISDYGSLSSLDFDKALAEVFRILRPGGTFIAAETFGHNPVTNLKREINRLRGSRTNWACAHIVKLESIAKMRELFSSVEIKYDVLLSLILGALPFSSPALVNVFGKIDRKLLEKPSFLQKYAFKVVIVACKGPA